MKQLNLSTSTLVAGIAATLIASAGSLRAETLAAASLGAADESSLYDRIWDHATLYEDDTNPILQKFVFTGRAQFDYTYTDGDQGEDYDYWLVRRIRAGFKATLWENFVLHAEAGFNPQSKFNSPIYKRLTDANLAWSKDPSFVLKVGKQSAPFTLDGHTSSKKLITIDRSNVSNNLWFPQEYMPGVSVSGAIDNWRYFGGFYSSGTFSPEFGDFDAGNFTLLSLGYDFADKLGVEEALVNLDYVYNKPDAGNQFTRNLRHVGSLNFFYENGDYGLRGDVTAGDGYLGQDDIYGFLIMPYYNLTEKLQLVGRYTYVSGSNGAAGVRSARYENRVVPGRGDNYNELYAGVNYYLYGHKLKWQTGVNYVTMDDDSTGSAGAYEGWGLTTGIRISW